MAAQAFQLRRRPRAPVPAAADPVSVSMRDGTKLATDLYLTNAPGRRVTALCRLPYDKCGESFFMPTVARWFSERGYAVAVQQCRGKLSSEGEVKPFAHEVSDGYDTIDWIVGRPWSDGRVVMIGDSYAGFTQWAAASSGHPALRAISPRVTSLELGDDWLFRQGVYNFQLMVDWVLHTWLDEHLYDATPDYDLRPLRKVAHSLAGNLFPAWADDWAMGRHSLPSIAPSDIPALHMGGWWDVFERGQLATWHAACAAGHSSQHLLMGARDHAWFPLRPERSRFVDPRLSQTTLEPFVEESLAPVDEFFRHVLGGTERPPIVSFELTGSGWCEADSWPPKAVRPMLLYAADPVRAGVGPEGGALLTHAERSKHVVDWVHDPRDPVPSLAPDPWEWLAAVPDERDAEVRPDVLTFSGEPLVGQLDIVGPVRVLAGVKSSSPSCHLAAKLVVVDPSGKALRLLNGITLVTATGGGEVMVELGDIAYRVPPRHRLRLEVAGSCYPMYAVHPGTQADPWEEADPRPSTIGVTIGGPRGLRVELTVAERA